MKRFSSYAFWVALAGAVAIFLEDITNLLGIDMNVSIVESLILSFCGILVVLGIVNKKQNDSSNENVENNLPKELENISDSLVIEQEDEEIDNTNEK